MKETKQIRSVRRRLCLLFPALDTSHDIRPEIRAETTILQRMDTELNTFLCIFLSFSSFSILFVLYDTEANLSTVFSSYWIILSLRAWPERQAVVISLLLWASPDTTHACY